MDTPPQPMRIELLGVDGSPDACVRLRRGTQDVTTPVYASGGLEGVAEATLDGVVSLLPTIIDLRLEDLRLVAGDRPVIVVIVLVTVAGVTIPHTGSALVGDRPELAAAKATLAAVNRRLEILPI